MENTFSFNKTINISKKIISKENPCFIIAEAGVNHGGDIEVAKKLIDIAAESGADAVKFQAFKADELILKEVGKAPYQKNTTDAGESQYEMLKKLEVTKDQNLFLKNYCEQKGIIFLTTPFEEKSLDELDSLDLPAYKIASTDTTNIPFLRKVAAKNKPMFLSTGMTYLSEVEEVLTELQEINTEIVLMHCTANYPIEDHEANLNVLHTFREKFDIIVGYSDHSMGLGAAPYSVAMGAKVVEKHFTLNTEESGPDHRASLNPEQLKEFVQEVKKVERMLGSFEKKPTDSELLTRKSLQKSLVYAVDLKKGDTINEDNILAKRTGGKGISPINYREIIGKKLNVEVRQNQTLESGQYG